MASRSVTGTIIILDVGKNVTTKENGKSFFDRARDCVARIIERKILSGGKDLLGVLLLGYNSQKKNEIAFKNIEWLTEPLEPTWNMIRNLPTEASKCKGDWMDALLVATDYTKNKIRGVKVSSMKIILTTNFKEPTSIDDDQIQKILKGLQQQSTFEIDIIGPEIYVSQNKNEEHDLKLARLLLETTGGVTETFDNVMKYLLYHKKKATKPVPWNVNLCIGPYLKIPISGYIRIRDEPVMGKWTKKIRNPVTLSASTTEYIIKKKSYFFKESQAITNPTNIGVVYKYGEQLIPVNSCDMSLSYKSGEKGLFVYGFTDASKIQWQNLNGEGIYYIFGRKGDKQSQLAITCLVECLELMKLAAVVRKVYRENAGTRMYALMPVIDGGNYICLSLIPLCFKEEIKHMAFPALNMKKYSCSPEQVNAFKDLIKAMNLSEAYDKTYDEKEAFPIAEAVSPAVQYLLDCIAFRALNPGKTLPLPREEIMCLFKVPPLIEEKSKKPLENIKQLFVLKEIQLKIRTHKISEKDESKSVDNAIQASSINLIQSKNKDDEPAIKLPVIDVKKIQKIGTVDPIGNFTTLIKAGKTLSELAADMSEVIENLIYFSFDNSYSKAINTWSYFRGECLKDDPKLYNSWLQKFKIELNNRKKDDVLNIIIEKKLDYILKCENNLSTYDNVLSHEESQIYENDTVPEFTEIKIPKAVNDMFDDM